jgi:hypothetical protein
VYPHPGYRPPPPSGVNPLVIVLIVLVAVLILGGGGCLLCVGLAASIPESEGPRAAEPVATATVPAIPTPTPIPKPAPIPAPIPKSPKAPAAPKTVDFVCPPGKAPGGVVRAGCLCGDQILGTACGPPGNFTEVVETPRGCRFTCN